MLTLEAVSERGVFLPHARRQMVAESIEKVALTLEVILPSLTVDRQ
jgi:hypothetical protein